MDLWLAEQLALAWLLLGDAVAEVDDPDHDHEVVNEDKGSHRKKKVLFLWTLSVRGGGSTPFHSFWGCFFLTSQKPFEDENSTKSQNYPQKC